MPQLSNPRHECFAALVAAGRSAAESYEEVGYRPNRHHAWSLKQKPAVADRITELLAERAAQNAQATAKAVEELALTQEWVLAELKRNAEQAAKLKQYGPSNRALELLGKQLGMFIDRAEITQANEFKGMSLEEMRQELVMRARRLGLDRELAGLLEGPKDQDEEDDRLNGNGGEA